MTASRKQKQKQRKTAAPAKGRVRRSAVRQVTSLPAAQSSVMPSSYYTMSHSGAVCKVRGQEFLIQVAKTAGQNSAAVFDMNPATWLGSRLVNIARSYEVYRYNKAKLMYVPSVGTTTQGAISIGFETDPNEQIPAEGNFYQRSMANIYATLGPVWAGQHVTYTRPKPDLRWFHASMEEGERRETSQLMAYAVTDSTTTSLGWLMVEYEIEFMYPEQEVLIGQENFSRSTFISSNPIINAGGNLNAGFDNAAGVRLMESIYTGLSALDNLRSNATNFNLAPGQSIYWAYDDNEATFTAYRTLAGARANVGRIVKIGAALAANALVGLFNTRVISRSTTGF